MSPRAMNQTSERMHAVIDALCAAGIDRKDIAPSRSTCSRSTATTRAITGYQASNSIDVKIREIEAASQTLALIGPPAATPPASTP